MLNIKDVFKRFIGPVFESPKEEVVNLSAYYTTEDYLDKFHPDVRAVHIRSLTARSANLCRAGNITILKSNAGRYRTSVNMYPYYILNDVMNDGFYNH